MSTRLPRLIPTVALIAILLPLLAACGDDDDDEIPTQAATIAAPAVESTAPPVASPEGSPVASPGATPAASPGAPALSEAAQILERASQRLAETRSIHFSLEVEGTTFIDDGQTIQLEAAEGNVVRPDRVQARFQAKVQGLAISTIGLITVGDQSWTTNIITGDWELAPTEFGYDATVLFSDAAGLSFVMRNAPAAEILPDEEIDGRNVYRIRTVGDQALIGAVTSNTMVGYPVAIDVWIDKETNDLLRVVLVESPSAEKDVPATWTLDLSRQNDDITIEPPEVEGESAALGGPGQA